MGVASLQWRILIGGIVFVAVAVTVGVSMWGKIGKSVELASLLNISDSKTFEHASIALWQPDPDHEPLKYFAIFDTTTADFNQLASELASQPSSGPLFSSPLTWKLPQRMNFNSWDDTYPDLNTPVIHATRGKWEVWAKLQGSCTFLVITKGEQ